MNRPLVPEDVKCLAPASYLVRAAASHVRAGISQLGGRRIASVESAAKELGFADPPTQFILRAASAPASTTTTSWAKEIAGVAVLDLVQSITSLSAGAEIIARSLKLNLDGIAEAHVPGRTLNPAAAGAWVPEGQPTPVRALGFSDAAILRPRRLSVISVYTREMAESSNIEKVVRATLGEATGLALDAKMFSADAASANAPPGLFAGTAPLTPVAGGGDSAMHGDVANLFAALAANAGGKTAVIVAALPQAVRLKMSVGPKFDYDILASTALAAGTVAVVEVASFVSGFSSVPEFSTSKVGAVHMEDTAPADIVSTGGAVASPVKSLFQVDAIALKTILWAAWGLRAAGHAQWIQNCTW
jgi:hypothetical protein